MAKQLFSSTPSNVETPLTADNAVIDWDGVFTGAVQTSISMGRSIVRRRTIGNKVVAVHATAPVGQMSIGRLLFDDAATLFNKNGFGHCEFDQITVTLFDCNNGAQKMSLTLVGCVVTSYNISLEGEGLTIMDNLSVEFVDMIIN